MIQGHINRRRLTVTIAAILAVFGAVCTSLATEALSEGQEELRIRIVNTAGGEIGVSRNGGESWMPIGSVVHPALRVNANGYTASKWAHDSAVCAAAVNAIHIKVTNAADTGKGIIFSLAPAGAVVGAATRQASAVTGTDIPAGESIFGGGLGPYVNSPVYLLQGDELTPLPQDYVPADGDTIVIIRQSPATALRYIEFENKFGGLVTAAYANGEREVIGQVLRPVTGVGRFPGGVDADCGRIRANHPGVIDISTSPLGYQGGFQIIPREHASSPELWYVREKTQWMVVGPVNALEPSWEGVAPLFADFILPSFRADDITGRHDDWLQRVLSRCQVQARINGGGWELLPRIAFDPEAPPDLSKPSLGKVWWLKSSLKPYSPLPKAAASALRDVTHIRIALPWTTFWPKDATQ